MKNDRVKLIHTLNKYYKLKNKIFIHFRIKKIKNKNDLINQLRIELNL